MSETVRHEIQTYLAAPRPWAAREVFAKLPSAAPVMRLSGAMWLVSGAAQVRELAASRALVVPTPAPLADVDAPTRDFLQMFAQTLSFQPHDDHRRLRRVLAGHFTPAGVAAIRPRIAAVVDTLLADALASGTGAGQDLVAGLTDRLPMRVMAMLLGADEADHAWLDAIGHTMLELVAAHFSPMGNVSGTSGRVARLRDLPVYVEALLHDPRPGSIAATLAGGVADGELSYDEAVRLVLLLFMTGIDTVSATLARTVLTVLEQDRARAAWLRGEIGTSALFAEAIRYDTPVPFAARRALENLQLGTETIAAGDPVLLCFAAANLDPSRYDDPLTFRVSGRPAPMSFGHGVFRCLGAILATAECELVLDALRPLGVRIDHTGSIHWHRELAFSAPDCLPVVLGRGWAGSGHPVTPPLERGLAS